MGSSHLEAVHPSIHSALVGRLNLSCCSTTRYQCNNNQLKGLYSSGCNIQTGISLSRRNFYDSRLFDDQKKGTVGYGCLIVL